MSVEIWIGIGIATVVIWGVIIWKLINSPIYPTDYKNVEEEAETRDAPPTNEKSPPSSQTYSESPKPKLTSGSPTPKPTHFEYPTTDCLCMGMVNRQIKHTKDCSWKNETIDYESDYQKMRKEDQEWSEDNWNRKVNKQSEGIQRLHILQTQLDVLHSSSDIAFDSEAQRKSIRIQAEIDDLMGKSTKGVKNIRTK